MEKVFFENISGPTVRAVFVLLFLGLLIGCNEEEPLPEPAFEIDFSPLTTELSFGYFIDTLALVVNNHGDDEEEWQLKSGSNHIQLSHTSGLLNPEDSVEIHVFLDRENLEDALFTTEITLQNKNVPGEKTIAVSAKQYTVVNLLSKGIVIDAKYNRDKDVIILVTSNPKELRVINPENKTTEALSLVLPPLALSVRPDGKYAVVAHNAWVSFINLDLMEIEEVFPVPENISDIIIGPNNWAYIISEERNVILSLDLSTGELSKIAAMHSSRSGKAYLHPSGKYFYRIVSSIDPARLEKFDIQSGAAEYLYGSWGNLGSVVWISDDGQWIFSNNRKILTSSSEQEDDMNHIATLEGSRGVVSFDYHSEANRIFSVDRSRYEWEVPDTLIRIYNATDFAFTGTSDVPDFLVDTGNGNGQFFDAEGHYGFFNADGSRIFLLVRPHYESEAEDQWGWVSFPVQ